MIHDSFLLTFSFSRALFVTLPTCISSTAHDSAKHSVSQLSNRNPVYFDFVYNTWQPCCVLRLLAVELADGRVLTTKNKKTEARPNQHAALLAMFCCLVTSCWSLCKWQMPLLVFFSSTLRSRLCSKVSRR